MSKSGQGTGAVSPDWEEGKARDDAIPRNYVKAGTFLSTGVARERAAELKKRSRCVEIKSRS